MARNKDMGKKPVGKVPKPGRLFYGRPIQDLHWCRWCIPATEQIVVKGKFVCCPVCDVGPLDGTGAFPSA